MWAFLLLLLLRTPLCVFRHLSGFFAVGGSGSARVYRHTTTTAGIRAPTTHPSGVAASRRCPPSAPAPDVAIQSPAQFAVPPATNKCSSLAWKEAEGRSWCRLWLRTAGRRQRKVWWWMGRVQGKRSPKNKIRFNNWGLASWACAPNQPLRQKWIDRHCWYHKAPSHVAIPSPAPTTSSRWLEHHND